MPLHLSRQSGLLPLVPELEQLLNDIVAKHVGHELKGVWENLVEYLSSAVSEV